MNRLGKSPTVWVETRHALSLLNIFQRSYMPMLPADKKQLKKAIQQQILEQETQLLMSEGSSKPVVLDQTLAGRVSRIDAIQQQKMAQASFNRSKLHLKLLKNTLAKIDSDDNYPDTVGLCEDCDEKIPLARLLIKPESKLCIACQTLMES